MYNLITVPVHADVMSASFMQLLSRVAMSGRSFSSFRSCVASIRESPKSSYSSMYTAIFDDDFFADGGGDDDDDDGCSIDPI